MPWDEIQRLLATEFGAPAGDVFAQVESQPLAAASIAQVHRARLRTGEQVVVKVRRPGIEEIVDRDLDIALRLANVLHRRTTWAGAIGIRDLAQGFAVALSEELDFTIEARNLTSVAATTRSAWSRCQALVHQTLLTILAAATGIVAAILLGTDGGPQVAAGLSLYQLLAYNLLIVGGVLTLRVLTSLLSSTNGS